MNWNTLNQINQIQELEQFSHQKPVLIFKHSTRCSISRTVLNRFESAFTSLNPSQLDCYLLDLLNHRDLSNQLAIQFNVQHESPQVIVLLNGKTALYKSHYEIDLNEILHELN
jgi:bacillithiol system protein YtxJ